MKKEKRNYWFKLKYNFVFEPNSCFDFLMTQENGANYVVLYEMLCLLTVNTGGVLVKDYGEVVIRLNLDQIKRETKYFSRDTILVAIELFKKLGLVAEDPDGFIEISNFDELVSSETEAAARMRRHRLKKAAKCASLCYKDVTPIVTQEKRYKIEDTINDSTDNELSINSSCSNNYKDNNEQIPLQNPNKTRTEQSAIGGDSIYPQCEYDDVEQSEIMLKKLGGKYKNLLISDAQFESLCSLLSLDEIDTYCEKMEHMLEKGYKFNCSHYEKILQMVEQDRKVRQNE
ncbi:MAG: phage replisome organizer N-terminal domain-containing protein [Clostridia bacterium]|nr:phage replisome organizer N-terminal domain-containing protein [Clostridia bacterium]